MSAKINVIWNLTQVSVNSLWHEIKPECYVAVRWELPGGDTANLVLCDILVSFIILFCIKIKYLNNQRLCVSVEWGVLCGSNKPGLIRNPMTNQTIEIDECELMPQMCKHGACLNTPGSFECICNHGFEFDLDSHQCIGRILL